MPHQADDTTLNPTAEHFRQQAQRYSRWWHLGLWRRECQMWLRMAKALDATEQLRHRVEVLEGQVAKDERLSLPGWLLARSPKKPPQ